MKSRFKQQAERIVSKSGIEFPFPENLDFAGMPAIQFVDPYHIEYVHSYGQDSPFFLGLKNRRLLGSACGACGYRFATPRGSCMYCGGQTAWFELPQRGVVHAFTVCHQGSEKFLEETPFALALVEFEGIDTLFLSRLKAVAVAAPSLDWIGMPVQAKFSRLLARAKRAPSVADVWFEPLRQAQ